jgi:hypothetical protein
LAHPQTFSLSSFYLRACWKNQAGGAASGIQDGFLPLWHAPLDFSGGAGRTWMNYIQLRVVFFIAITVLFTWFYNRSRGLRLFCTLASIPFHWSYLLPRHSWH